MLVRRARLVDLDGARAGSAASGARPDVGSGAPVDVLIVDGVIDRVGVEVRAPSGVEVIDAAGRWAIPGLWDAHVHAGQWVRTARMLPLGAAGCAADVLAVVAAAAPSVPSGRVVLGFGYRAAGWPRPGTVAELDAVSDGRAVALVSGDAHTGWLNSRALQLLGAAPRIGPVSENEWFELLRRLDELPGAAPTPADFVAPLAGLAALGVTGLVDFEFENSFVDWPVRIAAGADSVRVRAGVYPHQLRGVIDAGLRTGDALPVPGQRSVARGAGSPHSATARTGAVAGRQPSTPDRLPVDRGLVTMGPLKIISDGSLGSRTAWTHEPYTDGAASPDHPCGQANYSAADLVGLLAQARECGLEVALHAIGDRAVGAAIDAFAATGARGSIEHAQLISRADARRLATLGVRASVQPAHLLDDRDLTDRVWGERGAMAFALADLLRAGVDLRLGSDAPVAPLDPWLAMATAVHRSGDERPAWHPEQSITPREAMAASVDGRRLTPGAPGDLVLLDRDPLAVADDPRAAAGGLCTTRSTLTVCAGRITHRTL